MISLFQTLLVQPLSGEVENLIVEPSATAISWMDRVINMMIEYAPKLIGAVIIYFVGTWAIKWIGRLLAKTFEKRSIDPSLRTFLRSVIRISLLVLLILTIIGILGVNITGFAALLAGAGLAIGGALNGSLGNFAGGVIILLTKPFRVGDLIEAQNHFGIVKAIGMVDTVVLTSQNKTVHVPNGALSTGVITNYTSEDNFRIDIRAALKDGTDIDFARKVALEALVDHPDIIKDPAPDVKLAELTGDGPVIVIRPRIKIKPYDIKNPRQMEADYYSVYFGAREMIYNAFVKNGIQTPDLTHEIVVHNK